MKATKTILVGLANVAAYLGCTVKTVQNKMASDKTFAMIFRKVFRSYEVSVEDLDKWRANVGRQRK